MAAYRKHEPAVIELLRWGSNVTQQNYNGDTAWDLTQDLFMRSILAGKNYCIKLHKIFEIIKYKSNKNKLLKLF